MAKNSMKFLLVDDLEENLLALSGLLHREEVELLQARSGPEALELLLVHDVALAIVDVQMPGMDGFELVELMRGTERTRRVPVIFVTAGGVDTQRRFRGYEAGTVDFLYKPIEPHILRSKAEVFSELYRQRQEVACQRDELRAAAIRLQAANAHLQAEITERKRAEEDLRDSRQNFQVAIDAAELGTWTYRLADQGWELDERAQAMYDMPGPSARHDTPTLAGVLHPDDLPLMWQRVREACDPAGEGRYHAEYRVLQGNGRVRWLSAWGRVEFEGEGSQRRPVRMMGASRDITKQKEAEETLRESEERFRALVAASSDGIYRMSPDWSEMRHLRGQGFIPDTESPDDTWFQRYIYPKDQPHVMAVIHEAIRTKGIFALEHRVRRKDGSVGWTFSRAVPLLDASGDIVEWFGAASDITERKRAEEELQRAKAAAEEANEAKSRFMANISHELRTPMNAILGMVDLALPKQTDPTATDFLRTARESADLLLALLNDLLDSAKIEAGKLELESAPFRLRHILDQTTQVLAVRASEKGISFSCRILPEVPDALVGDQVRLRQILLNLAGNGIKFTDQGEVTIRVWAESLMVEEACLKFAVRDTGIGIPPSGLERLFQPFAQADASMTRRFGGTGLGLSISKSLVELMGGRIWAKSEIGKGSTFYFTVRLPLAEEPPADLEAPLALPTAACGPLRVLLVEDNPANQKLATYLLQDRGHVVAVAGDGHEAVCLTEQNRYDVILMDVQMPGMNGLEATAAIRKRENGGSRVPIIAMTAHAMKGDRERCLAAGMDGYLSKPVNAREMIGLVEALACGSVPAAQLAAAVLDPAEALSCETFPVFNPEEALARCFNSQDMVREMIQCFQEEVTSLFPQMRAALGRGDLMEVGRLGHRIKGTLVYLGAQPAKEAVLGVERFCQANGGTREEAEEAINTLQRECQALEAVLREYRRASDAVQSD